MNTKPRSIALQKDLLLLGAVLVIIGSFLPWEVEGDFVSTWRYGIQIYPALAGHGGIILLLLSMGILLFVSRLEGSRRYVTKNILTSTIFLFILSAYHGIDWLVRRLAANGIVGAPAIRAGLILVMIGSAITLATAFYLHAKESASYPESEKSSQVVSSKSR